MQWSAYPALLLAACLAAGIAAADQWPTVPPDVWAGAGVAAVACSGWALVRPRRRLVTLAPLAWTCAAALGVFALGAARHAGTLRLPEHHIAHHIVDHVQRHPLRYVTVEGSVRGQPHPRAHSTQLILEARRMVVAGDDTLEATGRVQTTLVRSPWKTDAPPFPAFRAGDRVRLTGQLEAPPQRRNPADFGYGDYLRRRGIYATLVVTRAADVERLETADERSSGPVVSRGVETARDYADRQIRRFVPSEEAQGVLRALILGDRSRIAAPTRERFARTGLLHVLAVSGLHVLLVGMIFYQLVRPTLMRVGFGWKGAERLRAALTILLLVAYALLTGAAPSVMRAVVMAGVFIGGVVMQRRAHALNALGVAALVVLAVQPEQLFGVGFQLSFAAVGAIVTLVPMMKHAAPAWVEEGALRQPVNIIAGSVAATLGTLPVLLWHFGYASFAGLALNIVAIPSTALTLGSGLLAVLLGGWLAPVAASFGAATDACARVLLWTAEAGDAALGWAAVHAQFETLWPVGALTAGLVMGAQWGRPRLRWRWAAVALVLASAGVWQSALRGANEPHLDMLFFDVGQGDATLLSLPGGQHVLVDAGPRTPYTDYGAETVLAHLRRFGIQRLDAVVVTHADSDHLGGLPSLVREVPVGRVIHNGTEAASALYAESMHVLDSLEVEEKVVQAGDTLRFGPHVRAYVVSPGGERAAGMSDNDASVALVVAYGDTRVLLAGDAEAGAERRMVRRFGSLLASDLIKVGHHGSPTSSTPVFVGHAAADSSGEVQAVISAGKHNPFGLPDSGVVERWRGAGAEVSVTAEDGAVWFRSDGKDVVRVRWR